MVLEGKSRGGTMVEILILVAIIIGIRSLYLWATKGKEEAKEFADRGAKEVNQTMAWVALVAGILFLIIIAALASY